MTPAGRAQRVRAACADDEGAISLYIAIMAVAFIAMLGLVVDGGGALSTRERAADLATQAARAGANSFTATSLRGAAGGLAEANTATSAAERVVIDAGLNASAAQVTVRGTTVTVKVTVPKRTVILSAVGLDDISQSATGTATAVYGGTTQEGG
jgi:Flp pilus assembly protein TadG